MTVVLERKSSTTISQTRGTIFYKSIQIWAYADYIRNICRWVKDIKETDKEKTNIMECLFLNRNYSSGKKKKGNAILYILIDVWK